MEWTIGVLVFAVIGVVLLYVKKPSPPKADPPKPKGDPLLRNRPGAVREGDRIVYNRASFRATVEGDSRRGGLMVFDAQTRRKRPALCVHSKGGIDVSKRFPGAKDIEFGDREFDEKYIVIAPNAKFAKSFLDDRVRRAIRELEARSSSIRLDLWGSQVRLQIKRPYRCEALGLFLDVAEILAEAAAGPEAVPVESEIQEVAGGACQVCGETMTDAIVRCALCRTSHHRECWDYMGSCSTFGRGGTALMT